MKWNCGGRGEGEEEIVLTIESSEINVIGRLIFLNNERLMVRYYSIYYKRLLFYIMDVIL